MKTKTAKKPEMTQDERLTAIEKIVKTVQDKGERIKRIEALYSK